MIIAQRVSGMIARILIISMSIIQALSGIAYANRDVQPDVCNTSTLSAAFTEFDPSRQVEQMNLRYAAGALQSPSVPVDLHNVITRWAQNLSPAEAQGLLYGSTSYNPFVYHMGSFDENAYGLKDFIRLKQKAFRMKIDTNEYLTSGSYSDWLHYLIVAAGNGAPEKDSILGAIAALKDDYFSAEEKDVLITWFVRSLAAALQIRTQETEDRSKAFRRYSQPSRESDRFFIHTSTKLFLSRETLEKYNNDGTARPFPGLTVINWVNEKTEAYRRLLTVAAAFKKDLEQAGLSDICSFMPPETFHVTLYDIVTRQAEWQNTAVAAAVSEVCEELRDQLSAVPMEIKGIGISSGTSFVAWVYPKNAYDLETMYLLRERLREKLQPIVGDGLAAADKLIAHITLAYLTNNIPPERYEQLKNVLRRYEGITIADYMVEDAELRAFKNMEVWGRPIQTLRFSKEDVLPVLPALLMRQVYANALGFLSRGKTAPAAFTQMLRAIRTHSMNGMPEMQRLIWESTRMVANNTAVFSALPSPMHALQPAIQERLRTLRIYGFDAIIKGRDDFFLGEYRSDSNELYVATDFLHSLKKSGISNLDVSYVVYLIIRSLLSSYSDCEAAATVLEQRLFPAFYRSEGTEQKEGIIYNAGAAGKPLKMNKGLLGESVRYFVRGDYARTGYLPATVYIGENGGYNVATREKDGGYCADTETNTVIYRGNDARQFLARTHVFEQETQIFVPAGSVVRVTVDGEDFVAAEASGVIINAKTHAMVTIEQGTVLVVTTQHKPDWYEYYSERSPAHGGLFKELGLNYSGLIWEKSGVLIYARTGRKNLWSPQEDLEAIVDSVTYGGKEHPPLIGGIHFQTEETVREDIDFIKSRPRESLHHHPSRGKEGKVVEVYYICNGEAGMLFIKKGIPHMVFLRAGDMAIVEPGTTHAIFVVGRQYYEHLALQIPSTFQYGFMFKEDVSPEQYYIGALYDPSIMRILDYMLERFTQQGGKRFFSLSKKGIETIQKIAETAMNDSTTGPGKKVLTAA